MNMTCSKKLLAFLILVTSVSFCLSSQRKGSDKTYKLSVGQDIQCSHDSDCPTWFMCNSSKTCQCGNTHNNAVICNQKYLTSAILDCHCVTYDKESSSTNIGSCIFNCDNHRGAGKVYQPLPQNTETLIRGSVCTKFHRAGLLCGDCEEGYSPFVHSYNLSCVKCPDGNKNWWKFLLAGFVPLTVFYFFVVIIKMNVTTSRLHGVVWFSQALSMPALVRVLLLAAENEHLLTVAKICLLFYSFWNLDLFRSIIPDICLNVTTLQALALDYLIAFYPFLLILLSHLVIKLYDSKIPCLVMVWRPFRALLTNFRQSMDIRTSVIDSFATFFLLSYVKILSITSDLLIPTQIFQLGSNKSTLGLYYSPSIAYFGNEHLPYAVLAIAILALFVCVPTAILLLYPFQFFQRFLSFFPLNWHYLRAFIDSFQGCFKDGTEPGTFDCRWFSALHLLVRLLLFILFALTSSMIFFVYAVIIIVTYLIVVINIQPFKKAVVRYPSTDLTFLMLLSFSFIVNIGRDISSREGTFFHSVALAMLPLSAVVPLIYIAFFVSVWLVRRIKWIHKLINKQRYQ